MDILKSQVNDYINTFRGDLLLFLQNDTQISKEDLAKISNYANNYSPFDLSRQDLDNQRKKQRRQVDPHNKCMALVSKGTRCPRNRMNCNTHFCTQHQENRKFGEVEIEDTKLVQISLGQFENGIKRFVDKDGNVYDSKNILQQNNNRGAGGGNEYTTCSKTQIIGKAEKNSYGTYVMKYQNNVTE